MVEPTVIAAGISAVGVACAATLTWRMNLSVRERTRAHDRELATLRSDLNTSEERLRASLRLETETSLTLRQREWDLLREVTAAAYNAQRKLSLALSDQAKHLEDRGPSPSFAEAIDALANLQVTVAAVPPHVDFQPMLDKFVMGLDNTRFTRRPIDSYEYYNETGALFGEGLDAGRQAILEWGTRLWEDRVSSGSAGTAGRATTA